jgi:hypothetical protein
VAVTSASFIAAGFHYLQVEFERLQDLAEAVMKIA